jgi:hypothetical protein
MRLNSDRDYRAPADPNAYWRRRFIVLLGALTVLAGFAWLFTGNGAAPSAARSAAAGSSMAALRAGDGLPSAAYGSAWAGDEPTLATPITATPEVTAQPNASQPANSASPSPAASASAAVSGPACAPGDIVLSLSTSKGSYGPGAWPQFDVYAVSTGPSPCLMAYGAGAVRVVVTWHGRVVWDSTSCDLAAAKNVQFRLGVPRVLTIRWNRQAAGPSGCAGSLAPGATGTFDAVAMAAGQSSQVRSFALLR